MRPALEVADIVRAHGDEFRQVHATSLSTRQKRVLRSIELCRTAALGGHLNNVTNAATNETHITPAPIAIAPSVSPWPERSGSENHQPDVCHVRIFIWCFHCQSRW